MKKQLLQVAGVLACMGITASCHSEQKMADYQVIPLPQEIVVVEESPFTLSKDVKIRYPKGNEKMQNNAQFLAQYLKLATGQNFAVEAGTESKNAIVLQLDLATDQPEAYQVKVNSEGITIAASSEAGVFYGIQTLRKSIPVAVGATVTLPAIEINDYPRFGYRGVHFDVSRHFFTVDEVKSFIDMMALHNMNRMHWHLSEDQGWRLEIKKYPKLTEIGSKRTETVIGRNTGEYDGKPYGGFYTQEEAREIVSYAADRYITVIPEIDLPGHMQAALASYPHLGCTGGPYEVWRKWGISDHVLCAGNDSTLTFIKDVLAEVIDIFPSDYIHIGGDECPKTQWEKCPKCQSRIQSLGLKADGKHSKEQALQSYVMRETEKFLNEQGRQIIGWDEILEGGLAPNATVMSWRGEAGGIEAAKLKHPVIMTPNTYLYFDYYQTRDIDNEPLGIGGYLPLERVYSYEPIPASLTAEEQKYIVGVQANHWTEYIPTLDHLQYMALPRWAALAEVQWSVPANKNYADFLTRLPQLIKQYDAANYNYGKHVFDVKAEFNSNQSEGTLDVTLTTIDNAPIHYTIDGTEPTSASPVYHDVLRINESGTLKAVAIRSIGRSQTLSEEIVFSPSTLKPIVANQPIYKNYVYKGITTLVDGLKGGENYRTGRWIAYIGNDMDITIDLQELTTISSVELSTCVEQADWVFDARGLALSISTDGKEFTEVASETYPAMQEGERGGVYTHSLTFSPVQTRFVKVVALSERSIPAWHTGKGTAGFLFVDEVVLN